MKKVLHKCFWIWEFDKEEEWLNQMSAQGWQLRDVSLFRYVFEKGEPCEYAYKLELLDNLPGTSKSVEYIEFIEETGIEMIGSLMRWVYFRKKNDGKGFEIFSDLQSKINHINRILAIAVVCLGVLMVNTGNMLRLFFEKTGVEMFFVLFILTGSVFLLILYGTIRLLMKRHNLVKQKILHE